MLRLKTSSFKLDSDSIGWGRCKVDGGCKGPLKVVEVFDQFDYLGSWGKYIYCETAIKKDEDNGYRVEIV